MDHTNSLDERKDIHNTRPTILFRGLLGRLSLSLLLVFAIVMSTITPAALATKSATSKRPVKLPRATAQTGNSIVIYGPHQFVREEGSPVTVTEEFSIELMWSIDNYAVTG